MVPDPPVIFLNFFCKKGQEVEYVVEGWGHGFFRSRPLKSPSQTFRDNKIWIDVHGGGTSGGVLRYIQGQTLALDRLELLNFGFSIKIVPNNRSAYT